MTPEQKQAAIDMANKILQHAHAGTLQGIALNMIFTNTEDDKGGFLMEGRMFGSRKMQRDMLEQLITQHEQLEQTASEKNMQKAAEVIGAALKEMFPGVEIKGIKTIRLDNVSAEDAAFEETLRTAAGQATANCGDPDCPVHGNRKVH